MSVRSGARIQSLCGTTRRIKQKQSADVTPPNRRRPCRYHAIWACQGLPDRDRRLAESPR